MTFPMQLIAYTSSRPGSIVESIAIKGRPTSENDFSKSGRLDKACLTLRLSDFGGHMLARQISDGIAGVLYRVDR